MNTNSLKRFAREARIKLIDQVGRKLEFVLSNTDPVFIDTNATQIQSLKNKIQALGKEQVIDTVAYTWLNRLMALRFIDANGYTTPKVVTFVVGKSPEILQNALSGQIDENLKLNRQRLNELLFTKANFVSYAIPLFCYIRQYLSRQYYYNGNTVWSTDKGAKNKAKYAAAAACFSVRCGHFYY